MERARARVSRAGCMKAEESEPESGPVSSELEEVQLAAACCPASSSESESEDPPSSESLPPASSRVCRTAHWLVSLASATTAAWRRGLGEARPGTDAHAPAASAASPTLCAGDCLPDRVLAEEEAEAEAEAEAPALAH